jgi:hypothetical protein
MQEAVAPAIIPPVAWTSIIVDLLGAASSRSVPWPKSLPKTISNFIRKGWECTSSQTRFWLQPLVLVYLCACSIATWCAPNPIMSSHNSQLFMTSQCFCLSITTISIPMCHLTSDKHTFQKLFTGVRMPSSR